MEAQPTYKLCMVSRWIIMLLLSAAWVLRTGKEHCVFVRALAYLNIQSERLGSHAPLFLQVDEDEPLFLSLISDLFPGIQLDNATYEELQVAIQDAVDSELLVNHPSWNLKVVQVRSLFAIRALLMT